jgi:hypothetical protein
MRPSLATAIGTMLIAGIGMTGCGDVTAPGEGGDAQITATGETLPTGAIRQSADAPPLLTYDTTFVVVQGLGETFTLYYEDPADGSAGDWFMKIWIPSDAEFMTEDGVPYADGDTVSIATHVDPSYLFVRFGPHGSTFLGNRPALLRFSTKFMDLGERDVADLRVWYQPSVGSDWTVQETVVDHAGHQIWIDVHHFSNYSVAWFF